MKSRPRPLSPHLQVYRPQITSVLSIVHRMSGVFLVFGLIPLTYWLASAAYGPEAFATAQALLGSILGRLVLFAWTFCLYYHTVNGLRHLAWDIGWGFEMPVLTRSGWTVLSISILLTLGSWVAAYGVRGG